MAASKYKGPAQSLASYAAAVDAHPEAELKGASMPYTSRNGHMFSFLDPDGNMALRLSRELLEEFVARYDTPPVEQHGSVMKEYVAIPSAMLSDTAGLRTWFDRSFDWIGTLTPKPTTRKRG